MRTRALAGLVAALLSLHRAEAADGRVNNEPGSLAFRDLIKREAELAGVPYALADAVVAVESGYDPTRVGAVGEIGLMQVRPSTAAMLGFRGTDSDLAKPDINLHFGAMYLAGAWRRASGDLCRALMKYRAGHGEDVMTPRSADYCNRARAHLGATASGIGLVYTPPTGLPVAVATRAPPAWRMPSPPVFKGKVSDAVFRARRMAYVKAATAVLDAHQAERAAYIQWYNATFVSRREAYVKAATAALNAQQAKRAPSIRQSNIRSVRATNTM